MRKEARLTLRAVARATGTSESNVSAYERGAKVPNAATEERLRAACRVSVQSPIHSRSLLTAAAAAAAIRKGLRDAWATADLLRIVREMRSHFASIHSETEVALFFAAPSTTGDQRWDAMLAATIEDLALQYGRDVPVWTRGRALDTFWFVTSTPTMAAHVFAHSPMSMQVRGVMVDPDDLAAV